MKYLVCSTFRNEKKKIDVETKIYDTFEEAVAYYTYSCAFESSVTLSDIENKQVICQSNMVISSSYHVAVSNS